MISVIIPVRNSAEDIERLLDGVARTSLADYEVIVADDASTDDTAQRAARRGARVVALSENRGPGPARNAAAAVARGEILVFLDSDVVLHHDRDVLADMARAFDEDEALDCVISISDVRPTIENAVAYNSSVYHAYYMERFLAGDDARSGRLMFFTTRLGAIRARRFREAGGFHEGLGYLMNEDGEFGTRCYHLGFRTRIDRRLAHHHRYPTRFGRFARGYFLNALGQALVDRRFDTSADESVSGAEKGRRLLAMALWAAPFAPVALGPVLGGAVVLAGGLAFFASFGPIHRLVWSAVPPRHRAGWYLVYVGVTPAILAGYAAGVLLDLLGRSPLDRPRSHIADAQPAWT